MRLMDAKGTEVASYTYVTTDDNGLYYMRQRYYNPEIKRFVNQDVLTGSIGNSQSLNRYSYVQGNPVSYTDPFGLSPFAGMFEGTTLIHGVLGVLGCVPFFGVAFNVLDAWVYFECDKDPFMGTLCLATAGLSVVGGFGRFVMGGTKFGNYLAKSCAFLSNGIEFTQNGLQAIATGYTMWDKYVINGQEMGWDTVGEVVGFSLSLVASGVSGNRMLKGIKSTRMYQTLDNDNRGCTHLLDGSHTETSYGKSSGFSPKPNTTRINLANGRTRFTPLRQSGKPVSAGMNHVIDQHFNRPLANSRSIFSISVEHLKEILQRKDVISSPLTDMGGGQYKRIVDTGEIIGNTALKYGGNETSWIEIITDVKGNIITTYPVPGK